jgi:hypothetical protein
LVVDAAEVVGFDAAAFGFCASEFVVIELDDAAVEQGLGEGFEDFQFLDGVAYGAEGDGAGELLEGKGAFVLELGGHFGEGGMEGLFEGGAAVLLEGFLGDEEGDDLAFGHGEGGEGGDLAGVVESAVEGAILEGEVHAVAHEVDIALDGFRRDLEFLAEGIRVLWSKGARPATFDELKAALREEKFRWTASAHGYTITLDAKDDANFAVPDDEVNAKPPTIELVAQKPPKSAKEKKLWQEHPLPPMLRTRGLRPSDVGIAWRRDPNDPATFLYDVVVN